MRAAGLPSDEALFFAAELMRRVMQKQDEVGISERFSRACDTQRFCLGNFFVKDFSSLLPHP